MAAKNDKNQKKSDPKKDDPRLLFPQYASEVVHTTCEWAPTRWSNNNLLGGPKVYPLYGDDPRAWSHSYATLSGEVQVIVSFPQMGIIEKLDIYETYCCGAIRAIQTTQSYLGKDANTKWTTLWEGKAVPLAPVSRVWTVPLTCTFPVQLIKLIIDGAAVPGWKNIDSIRMWYREVNEVHSKPAGMPEGFKDGSYLQEARTELTSIKHPINVLVIGKAGAGKSSFINTTRNVFRPNKKMADRLFQMFRLQGSQKEGHISTDLWIEDVDGTELRLWDVWGWDGQNYKDEEMSYIVNGFARSGFTMGTRAHAGLSTCNPKPTLDDAVHGVILVVDGKEWGLSEVSQAEQMRFRTFRDFCHNAGLFGVVVVTKIDAFDAELNGKKESDLMTKVDKLFGHEKVNELLDKVSDLTGFPRGFVYPIKNYHNETHRQNDVESLAMMPLFVVIQQADLFYKRELKRLVPSGKSNAAPASPQISGVNPVSVPSSVSTPIPASGKTPPAIVVSKVVDPKTPAPVPAPVVASGGLPEPKLSDLNDKSSIDEVVAILAAGKPDKLKKSLIDAFEELGAYSLGDLRTLGPEVIEKSKLTPVAKGQLQPYLKK
jgi:GTPase SAR1 family protein